MHHAMSALKQRREARSADQFVLWKELDLIIELLEACMEGIKATEEALAQLKADSEARDEAVSTALTDLQDEVRRVEQQGVDVSGINAGIRQLDEATKVGKSEAEKADPGAQTTEESAAVSIGENGEGSTLVPHPLAKVNIKAQPSSGSATLAAEGENETSVKVTGAAPSTSQTVVLAISA